MPDDSEQTRLNRRRAFVEANRHWIGGMVMDAVAGQYGASGGRHGIELAGWARDRFRQIDEALLRMFDELLPQPAKPLLLSEAEKAKLDAEKKQPPRKP